MGFSIRVAIREKGRHKEETNLQVAYTGIQTTKEGHQMKVKNNSVLYKERVVENKNSRDKDTTTRNRVGLVDRDSDSVTSFLPN